MPFVIPFILILMFAFAVYALADINPSTAPLISLVTLVNISVLCALFNVLQVGVWVSYLLAVVAFAFAIYKNKNSFKEKLSGFFTPGVILFVVVSVAMLVCLSYTQPLVHQWDEYSFWAKSRQLIKNHNQLYTYYKSSMLGQSIPPALPVLSYFFQMLSPSFVEWAVYFAYDVLFFATFSAFTAAFDRKNRGSAAAVFVTAFIVPYFFSVTVHTTSLSSVYISAYSDMPLALLTAGTVAVYMFSQHNNHKRIIPALLMLIFLTFTKDMGFALGCIALFVIFFDILVARKDFMLFKLKGFMAKVAAGALMLVVTAGAFVGWSKHLSMVLAVDRTDYGGEAGMGMVEILLTGVKEFLIGPKSEKFLIIQEKFFTAFFNTKVSMIGSGLLVVAMIMAVFMVAVIFGDKNSRLRSIMMAGTSLVGFAGYYIFHLLLYVYVLSGEAYSLTSYERYIGTYYTAWLIMAVMCMTLAVLKGNGLWGKAATVGFMCCMVLVFSYYIRPENIFTGINEMSFATRRSVSKKVETIRDAVKPEDVIFVFSGEDSGERWFAYTFEMDENYIIPNADFVSVGETPEETKQLQYKEMYDRFTKYGVTNVLIDHSSVDFVANFAQLFDEDAYAPMAEVGGTMVSYYKVIYGDGNSMFFEFVEGGVVSYD